MLTIYPKFLFSYTDSSESTPFHFKINDKYINPNSDKFSSGTNQIIALMTSVMYFLYSNKYKKDLVSAYPRDYLTEAEFLTIQDEVKNKTGQKGKNLFFPIRIALIGKPHGAELKILVPLLSKASILERAETALEKC